MSITLDLGSDGTFARKAGNLLAHQQLESNSRFIPLPFQVVRNTACDEIQSTGASVEMAANQPRLDWRKDYVVPTDNSYYSFDGTGYITPPLFYWNVGETIFMEFTPNELGSGTSNSLFGKYGSSSYIRFVSGAESTIIDGETFTNGDYFTINHASVPFVVGTNYHLAFRWNTDNKIQLYIDGVYINQSVATADNTMLINYICRGFSSNPLNGYVKKFQYENRLLSASEILDRYNEVAIEDKYIGADSVNRYNAAAGVFTSGTYGWIVYGTNTIANVGNTLEITYSDDGSGAYNSLAATGDLDYDLIVGKQYRLTFDAKYTGGAAGVKVRVKTDVSTYTDSLTTSLVSYSIDFVATTAAADFIALSSLAASNVVTLDNLELTLIGNVLDLSVGKTSTKWYDRNHDAISTVTGATIGSSTDFGSNVHTLQTCPHLLTEPSFTNLFINSRVPVTQTITTVIGTNYCLNAKGTGIGTADETGGNGAGGTFTEVYSFEWTATTTSMVVTLVAGHVFDWVMLTDTEYPMNHVETAGVSITKAKDVLTGSGTSNTFNSLEGVLFVEMAALYDDGTTRYLGLSDGTTNNRVVIYYSSISNQIIGRHVVAGVSVFLTATVTDVTDFSKIAFKYKSGDLALWIDGVEQDTDPSTSVIAADALNNMSLTEGAGTSNLFAKTRSALYYNEILTDAQLTTLTT